MILIPVVLFYDSVKKLVLCFDDFSIRISVHSTNVLSIASDSLKTYLHTRSLSIFTLQILPFPRRFFVFKPRRTNRRVRHADAPASLYPSANRRRGCYLCAQRPHRDERSPWPAHGTTYAVVEYTVLYIYRKLNIVNLLVYLYHNWNLYTVSITGECTSIDY